MQEPFDFEVVTAVHSASRPIKRAVSSVLRNGARVGVIVVAHNISRDVIVENLEEYAHLDTVQVIELLDGIPSPSEPYNYGLSRVRARYFSTIGSDDELEAGAIDSWLRIAQSTKASVVIPKLLRVGGSPVPTPATRPFRTQKLHGVKDRLPYRTAGQLGLIDRTVFSDFRFTKRLARGEDIICSLKLWFSGERISFDKKGPAYLIHPDAVDRVSYAPQPVKKDFEFLDRLEEDPWIQKLTKSQRQSIAVKLIRTHLFDAALNRLSVELDETERSNLSSVAERILKLFPPALDLLSRQDFEIFTGIVNPQLELASLENLLRGRTTMTNPRIYIPKRLTRFFAIDAPLRYYFGTFFSTR